MGEKEEHPEKISEMDQLSRDRDDVPAGEGEDLRISLEPLGGDVVDGVHGRPTLREISHFARAK